MAKKPNRPKGNRGKRRPVKPILQAILLADQVYKDARTGKNVIAGTFNSLRATEFPTEFDRVTWAFICLTGIHNEASIILRFVDLSNDEILLETESITVRANNPLTSRDLAIPVPPIPMPHEGGFAFEIHSCDELLGSHRITTILMPADAEDEGDE